MIFPYLTYEMAIMRKHDIDFQTNMYGLGCEILTYIAVAQGFAGVSLPVSQTNHNNESKNSISGAIGKSILFHSSFVGEDL